MRIEDVEEKIGKRERKYFPDCGPTLLVAEPHPQPLNVPLLDERCTIMRTVRYVEDYHRIDLIPLGVRSMRISLNQSSCIFSVCQNAIYLYFRSRQVQFLCEKGSVRDVNDEASRWRTTSRGEKLTMWEMVFWWQGPRL
jgi:hypothetical protein